MRNVPVLPGFNEETKNLENEKHILQYLEYGKRSMKNVENEKYNKQGLEYGKKTEKRGK